MVYSHIPIFPRSKVNFSWVIQLLNNVFIVCLLLGCLPSCSSPCLSCHWKSATIYQGYHSRQRWSTVCLPPWGFDGQDPTFHSNLSSQSYWPTRQCAHLLLLFQEPLSSPDQSYCRKPQGRNLLERWYCNLTRFCQIRWCRQYAQHRWQVGGLCTEKVCLQFNWHMHTPSLISTLPISASCVQHIRQGKRIRIPKSLVFSMRNL